MKPVWPFSWRQTGLTKGQPWPEGTARWTVAESILPSALTLKMRGRSLDWAWITSEARTGVAENWGSLGGAEQVRDCTVPGCHLTQQALALYHCPAPTSDPRPAGGPHWLG